MNGTLYLIPATLGDSDIDYSIPSYNKGIINSTDIYIVENERTARRFLLKAGIRKPIDELTFLLLNKHVPVEEYSRYINFLQQGKNVGLISEAGCPAIADPGAEIVEMAHQKNIRVIPLVGPSSILLALMASGMNGQRFVFHGYLPIDKAKRIGQIKTIEKDAARNRQTQIFMETPYRNQSLFEDILRTCRDNTLLCIAADLTLKSEYIKTKTIGEWKKSPPGINKRPVVFLMHI